MGKNPGKERCRAMNFSAKTVKDAIDSLPEDEREFIHLGNCPPMQADSDYWNNCIEQVYVTQEA